MTSPKPKVAVVVPSGDLVHSRFMVCLVSLFQYSQDKFDLVIINSRSSLIGTGRQMGVDMAVQRGCEYVLFLDSDMVFPHTLLEELHAHQYPVVGATYVRRFLPTSWTHQEFKTPPYLGEGLRPVSRLPLGATLIYLPALKDWEKPYFRCTYPGDGTESGEDYYFCDHIKSDGHEVLLDAELSKRMGHIGVYVYTHHDLGDN